MSTARAIELLEIWAMQTSSKLDLARIEEIKRELEEPDDLRARVERLEKQVNAAQEKADLEKKLDAIAAWKMKEHEKKEKCIDPHYANWYDD